LALSLDIKDVIVPKVEPDLTSENVLVETFEEGQPMNVVRHHLCHVLTRLTWPGQMFYGDQVLRKKLARRGLELFFKMMFKDNFIHGDLHPGNMRVTGVDAHGNE
jgi:aarF domain-containing kinase